MIKKLRKGNRLKVKEEKEKNREKDDWPPLTQQMQIRKKHKKVAI